MSERPVWKRESVTRLIAAIIVAAVFLLTISLLTDTPDGRRQISDDDGATESTLCSILSEIEGVGEVHVMIAYTEQDTVSGVIVTAVGGGDPVVRTNLTKGVATLFDIPVSSVMVFEKSQEEKTE